MYGVILYVIMKGLMYAGYYILLESVKESGVFVHSSAKDRSTRIVLYSNVGMCLLKVELNNKCGSVCSHFRSSHLHY